MMRHGRPTIITARFGGTCAHCHQEFAAGTKILWGKGHGTRHEVCPAKPETPAVPEQLYADWAGQRVPSPSWRRGRRSASGGSRRTR